MRRLGSLLTVSDVAIGRIHCRQEKVRASVRRGILSNPGRRSWPTISLHELVELALGIPLNGIRDDRHRLLFTYRS